jgi:hypothetical protein
MSGSTEDKRREAFTAAIARKPAPDAKAPTEPVRTPRTAPVKSTLELDPELNVALRQQALARGTSLSVILRAAAEEYLYGGDAEHVARVDARNRVFEKAKAEARYTRGVV